MSKELDDYQFFKPVPLNKIKMKETAIVPSSTPFFPSKLLAKGLLTMFRDPLKLMMTTLIYRTLLLKYSFVDTIHWLAALLALAYNESRFNFQATNNSTVMYEGKRVKSQAIGLFQQTKANWTSAIDYYDKQAPLAVKKLINASIMMYGGGSMPSLDTLKDLYGNIIDPRLQVIPVIGMMMCSLDNISKHFKFGNDGWTPSDSAIGKKILASPRWKEFSDSHSLFLKDKYEGRVALLSLLQANGLGFYRKDRLYHMSDTTVLINNYRSILQTLNSDKLSGVLSSLSIMTLGDPKERETTRLPKYLSSKYGDRSLGHHKGIDFARALGTKVYAPTDSVVYNTSSGGKGGNTLRLILPSGEYIGLAHLQTEPKFKKGERLEKGQVIAYVGNTGSHTTGPHLHLSYKKTPLGAFHDPLKFLPVTFFDALWRPTRDIPTYNWAKEDPNA